MVRGLPCRDADTTSCSDRSGAAICHYCEDIRLRRCQDRFVLARPSSEDAGIWDYLGQKQQTSRHILQRSNSSATKGLGGFEIVSAPTKRVQTYLARMEMRKKLFQEITAQQSSDKVRLLNAGRLIQMCTTRWSHDRLFAELTRIQGVNPRERGGIIEDDWRPCPEGNRRTHRQILAAAK